MQLDEIIDKYKSYLSEEDERSAFIRIMASYDDPELAKDLANYVTATLNEQSVQGIINYEEFVEIFKTMVDGLYRRIMVAHLKEEEIQGHWAQAYSKKWAQFLSAYVYVYLYLTRILEGKDYEKALLEIKSRQPIHINQ